MRERSRQKKYRTGRNKSKESSDRFGKDRPRRQGSRRGRNQAELVQNNHVNRNEVCPFLARIYYCINGVNHYLKQDDPPKDRQLLLYLWMNSTLKQVADLLRAHLPVIRTKQRFIFTRVYRQGGKYIRQEMATVMVHKKDKKGFENEESTLQDHHFCIGDYLDVSINYK